METSRWSCVALAAIATACSDPAEGVRSRETAIEDAVPEDVLVIPLDVFPDDLDGDGFSPPEDFDDQNPRAFPGAPEIPCDGVDEDGDGEDRCTPDLDGDGIRAESDCDDTRADVSPLAPEIRCNGEDENCDGQDDCDSDGDGALDAVDLDPDDPGVSLPPPGAGVDPGRD